MTFLKKYIQLIEGDSLDEVLKKVNILSKKYKKVLVILDSNHTMDHV